MRTPSGDEIPQLVLDAATRLNDELQPIGPDKTVAVQLAVDAERQRIAGLESKGFAVAAFPLAVVATSAVLVGKDGWTTTFGLIAIVYAAFALISAGRIVNPGARASFVVADAGRPDWLSRLAATTEVNSIISISIQNRVYAALMDTARGTIAVAIATILLLINAESGQQASRQPPSAPRPTRPAAASTTPTRTAPPAVRAATTAPSKTTFRRSAFGATSVPGSTPRT